MFHRSSEKLYSNLKEFKYIQAYYSNLLKVISTFLNQDLYIHNTTVETLTVLKPGNLEYKYFSLILNTELQHSTQIWEILAFSKKFM